MQEIAFNSQSMKMLVVAVMFLFSFTLLSAQESEMEANITSSDNLQVTKDNSHTSKVAYYRALLRKNGMNISIKGNSQYEPTTSKYDYYNAMLEKNGFDVTIKQPLQVTKEEIILTSRTL